MAELIDAARDQEDDAAIALIGYCEQSVAAALRVSGVWPGDPLYDDARSQVLMTIWEQLPNFRNDSSPCTWMYRIARRVVTGRVLDAEFRHKRRVSKVLENSARSVVSTCQEGAQVEERDFLRRVFAELTEEHREILILRIVDEQSVRDVAETLYLSEGAVKARLHRAKKSAIAVARRLENADEY